MDSLYYFFVDFQHKPDPYKRLSQMNVFILANERYINVSTNTQEMGTRLLSACRRNTLLEYLNKITKITALSM